MNRSRVGRRARLGLLAGAAATVVGLVWLTALAGAGGAARTAAPVNTSLPTITGTAQVGQTLVGHRGDWSGNPTDFNDFWVRCGKGGGSCSNISGAHDRNGYTLKSVDVGTTIRFKVEAINGDGHTFATSAQTAVVTAAGAPKPPAANGCASTGGTVPIANISPPAHLVIDQTQVVPATITHSTRSLTARFHIAGCGGSVQGALVYITAVPYAMFNIPNEQPTGADGWATLQLTALPGFPVSPKQQLLVVFVRARKSGEDLLGGISARRLVSFRVAR